VGQRRAPRHTRPTSGLDLQSRSVRIGLGGAVTAMLVGAIFAAQSGVATGFLLTAQEFLNFYAGVFSLVSLTATVGLGLLTTERIYLPIRHRVNTQLIHRGTALIGVGFLVTHIGMKIAAGLVPPYGSVIPTTNLFVGMGAVASDLFIVVIATGVMRGRFAQAERPWMWRIMHDLAYIAWPVSILHGLMAGRAPAPFVSWSYILCLIAVGVALLLRLVMNARTAEPDLDIEEREAGAVPNKVPQPAPQSVPQPAPQAVPQPISLVGRARGEAAAAAARERAARTAQPVQQPAKLRRIG
jgi:hypothetical protein